ncbi:hypothetical protein BDW68DRAFT_84144 [Aspergillus falconensis]
MLAQWAARCLPGYSTLALLVLLLLSASDAIPGPWRDPAGNKPDRPALNLAQKIFIVYSFFVRLNTLLFTGRLPWALFYSFTQTSKVPKRRAAYLPSGTPEPSSPRGDPPPTALDRNLLRILFQRLQRRSPAPLSSRNITKTSVLCERRSTSSLAILEHDNNMSYELARVIRWQADKLDIFGNGAKRSGPSKRPIRWYPRTRSLLSSYRQPSTQPASHPR